MGACSRDYHHFARSVIEPVGFAFAVVHRNGIAFNLYRGKIRFILYYVVI